MDPVERHQAMQKPNVTVDPKLTSNAEDYRPFSEQFLKAHPSAAMKAVSNVLMCHVADMFMIVMDVMSRKYGHSVDEMVNTIREDPVWTDASMHPVIKSLTYFNQDEFYDMAHASDLSGQVWADSGAKKPAKRPRVGTKRKAGEVEAENRDVAAKELTDGIMKLHLGGPGSGVSADTQGDTVMGGDGGSGSSSATAPTEAAPKKKPTLKLKAAKAAAAEKLNTAI